VISIVFVFSVCLIVGVVGGYSIHYVLFFLGGGVVGGVGAYAPLSTVYLRPWWQQHIFFFLKKLEGPRPLRQQHIF